MYRVVTRLEVGSGVWSSGSEPIGDKMSDEISKDRDQVRSLTKSVSESN